MIKLLLLLFFCYQWQRFEDSNILNANFSCVILFLPRSLSWSLLIPSHCTCKKSVEWMKLWHLVKSNYNPHRRFRHPHRISSSVTYKVLKQYIFCFCLVLNIFTIEGLLLKQVRRNFDNRQKWNKKNKIAVGQKRVWIKIIDQIYSVVFKVPCSVSLTTFSFFCFCLLFQFSQQENKNKFHTDNHNR